MRGDPEFIAELNRAKSFLRERLRADVRSLASDAMATIRELVSSPDVAPSVRLRASLAILEAADGRPIAVAAPGRPGPGDASPIRGFRPCYGLS